MRGIVKFAVAAAVGAGMVAGAGSASAQSSKVNGVPFAEIEGTAGLWFGQQKFKTNLDAGGGSTSQLDWKNTAATLELGARINSIDSGLWGRVGGGVGINFGGSMNDLDSGAINSSTTAGLESKPNYYFGADLGWTPTYFQTKSVSISPFGGIFFSNFDFATKEGATCNQTDTYSPAMQALGNVNGQVCSGPGARPNVSIAAVPTDRVENSVTFWGPRVGVAGKYDLTSRLSLSAEAAFIFLGQYKNNDSHFSRGSAQPYYVDKASSGTGLQLQAGVDYHLPESGWTVGGGFRYWKFDSGTANSTADAQGLAVPGGTTKNTIETLGGMLRASYGF